MKLGKEGVVRESPRLLTRLPQPPRPSSHVEWCTIKSQPRLTHGHGREADPPGLHPQPAGGKHMTPVTDVPEHANSETSPGKAGPRAGSGDDTTHLTLHSAAWRDPNLPTPRAENMRVHKASTLSDKGPDICHSATALPTT